MNRKVINYVLVILAISIIVIIVFDFVTNKAGKSVSNPYEYNIEEYRKVDSTKILYKEVLTINLKDEYLSGIAVADSLIVLAAGNQLVKYDSAGKEVFRKQIVDTASCIAVDPNRQIWIGMGHFVVMYDLNGTLIKRWNSFGDRSHITSIAVRCENVYIADAGNRIVYHCNTKGQIIARIGEKNPDKGIPGYVIPSPYFDIAVDDSNFLWAVNPGMHSFENYNPDGSLRTSWGLTSFKIEGFSGCCNPAHIAILNDNSFITSEKGMPRVKLYDQHGEFIGVVASPDMFDKDSTQAPDIAIDNQNRVIALDFERKQIRIFEKKENEQ